MLFNRIAFISIFISYRDLFALTRDVIRNAYSGFEYRGNRFGRVSLLFGFPESRYFL